MNADEKPTYYAKVTAFAMAVLILMAVFGVSMRLYIKKPGEISFKAVVIHVTDGDTIMLKGASKPVRMLGIDTPELHHPDTPVQRGAREARDYLSKRVLGKEVMVTYIKGKAKDKYGRLLAFIEEGGSLVNEELVAKGLAYAYEGGDSGVEREARFKKLEAEARKRGLGVWNYE